MIAKSEAKLRPAGASAPTPTVVAPPPSQASPDPGATTGFKTYRSTRYPYSMEIPENWALSPEQPQISGIPVEVLGAPDGGPMPTDVGTLALPLQPDVDARAFYEAMRKGLRVVGIDPIDVGRRAVAGTEAFVMRASGKDAKGKWASTLVMFENSRVGWLIVFTTTPEQSDKLQPLFQRMLDSFQIGRQNRIV
jgi:hypothetical protein